MLLATDHTFSWPKYRFLFVKLYYFCVKSKMAAKTHEKITYFTTFTFN